MRHVLRLSALCLASTISAFPQAPNQHSDALDLLAKVAQHYADAKSYDIEWTVERTSTGKLSRNWSRNILIAAEAPGNRSHFEGHTEQGSAMQISDGKTVWTLRIEEHRYTVKPFAPADRFPSGVIAFPEIGVVNAKAVRTQLQSLVTRLATAEFLPDEDLTFDGHAVHCKVVRVRYTDQKRVDPNYKFDRRIWIDPERNIILKTSEHADAFLMVASGRLPLVQDETVVYSKTILDAPVPEDLFTFHPPSDSRQIAEFPDPRDTFGLSSMAGDPIPPLKFKAADGSFKSMESYRGKPVLIDFWATWCAPCLAAMPQLAELYKQAKSKGLVVLSVDLDEDAAKAAEFLKKHGYDWPNFHDGDGAIAKLLPSTGIPHMVLVDANGMVAYDTTGMDDNRLRTHIAELGPEFADLAPKPKAPPCTVALQTK